MGFMGIFNSIESVISSIGDEINVDQQVIDEVKKKLHHAAGQMERSRFPHVRVAESAFGSCHSGADLGFHHGKAHEVIADTLEGVLSDLTRFHDGLVKAEGFIQGADEGSASDLTAKKHALTALVSAASYSEGDLRNHESRNQHLGNGGGHR